MLKITDPAQLPDRPHYVVAFRNNSQKVASAEIIPADTITLANYYKHLVTQSNGERRDTFTTVMHSKPSKFMLDKSNVDFEMHRAYSDMRDYHENQLPLPVRKGSRD